MTTGPSVAFDTVPIIGTGDRGDFAVGQGTTDHDQYHEIFDVISFDDVLEDVIRRDQNFLGLFSKGPEIAALEHRWAYQVQMPQVLDLHENLLTDEDNTTFAIPNEQKARIVAESGINSYLIDPLKPLETMKVVTIGADDSHAGGFATITVERHITGTGIDHTGSVQFQIMDTPYPEGSSPVIMRLNEPSWFRTTCQMFERYIELTRHQIRAKVRYTDDYFAMQVEQNTKDVLDELAYALMHATWATPFLGSRTVARRTMGFLPAMAAVHDADGADIVPNIDSTGYVFDMDAIEILSRMVDDAKGSLGNGSGEAVLMMDTNMYDAAMELWGDKVVMIDRTDTTIGRKVKAIETKRDHVLRIMKDRRWPLGHVAILNPPDMRYRAFVGSDWVAEQYAKTRDSENWRLYGDYFAEFRHLQSNFALLTNVTTE